jgi:hypothetical protein
MWLHDWRIVFSIRVALSAPHVSWHSHPQAGIAGGCARSIRPESRFGIAILHTLEQDDRIIYKFRRAGIPAFEMFTISLTSQPDYLLAQFAQHLAGFRILTLSNVEFLDLK